jgi:hypothetical protein
MSMHSVIPSVINYRQKQLEYSKPLFVLRKLQFTVELYTGLRGKQQNLHDV